MQLDPTRPKTAAKERPILMSAPMVLATLADRKTVTRRIMKHWEYYGCPTGDCPHSLQTECDAAMQSADVLADCPFGRVGDFLWVREEWSAEHRFTGTKPINIIPHDSDIWYWADGQPIVGDWTKPKPSIFLPRWASRITLEVTSVRAERLQDISREDAIAEGIEQVTSIGPLRAMGWKDYSGGPGFMNPIDSFRTLWHKIHKADGPNGWNGNPWVWPIGLRRMA